MKSLRLLGAVQLVSYLIIGYLLLHPSAKLGFYFTSGSGMKETLLQLYGAGALSLIPSVVIFVYRYL